MISIDFLGGFQAPGPDIRLPACYTKFQLAIAKKPKQIRDASPQPLGTRDRRDASIKGLNSNNWTSPGAAKAIDGKHLEPLDGQTHTHMYAYREERERERDR